MAKPKKIAKSAAPPLSSAPARSRASSNHVIRLVLDVTPLAGTLQSTIASFTPSQREWMTSAQKSGTGAGTGARFVLEFPCSETRDIDEAIRALPGGLQAAVVHAEKQERL